MIYCDTLGCNAEWPTWFFRRSAGIPGMRGFGFVEPVRLCPPCAEKTGARKTAAEALNVPGKAPTAPEVAPA